MNKAGHHKPLGSFKNSQMYELSEIIISLLKKNYLKTENGIVSM